MQRTSRDPETLRRGLEEWLGRQSETTPTVTDLAGTEANGMSSDTLLFCANWPEREERLVARLAPGADDVPVFPRYDMRAQFETLRLVAALTDVPVPVPWACEDDPSILGAPFFVMGQVPGQVPPDVMPYPFGDNWLAGATPEQQRLLQDTTVDAIAALHEIPHAPSVFPFLERDDPGDSHLRRHVAHTRAWYDFVASDGVRSPLIESAFDWLAAHWPDQEGPPVLCWGDARIGNVLYADFAPAALLDWEMAGLGPRELDVAWLAYSHLVFQDLATGLGLPGMPDFLRPGDVAARYGHPLDDLGFYLAYSAVQWGIVFLRTGVRRAHFGELELPADPDDLIYNKAHLETMLIERSWS